MRLKHLLLASALAFAPLVAAHATPIMPTFSIGYSTGTTTNYFLLASGITNFYSQSFMIDGGYVGLTASYAGGGAFDLSVTSNGTTLPSQVNLFLAGSNLPGSGVESISGLLTNNTNYTPQASSLIYTLYAPGEGGLTQLASNTISGTQTTDAIYVPSFYASSLYSLTQEISILPMPSGPTNVSLDGSISVPEPGSLALLGTAMLGLGLVLRRRNRRA